MPTPNNCNDANPQALTFTRGETFANIYFGNHFVRSAAVVGVAEASSDSTSSDSVPSASDNQPAADALLNRALVNQLQAAAVTATVTAGSPAKYPSSAPVTPVDAVVAAQGTPKPGAAANLSGGSGGSSASAASNSVAADQLFAELL